MKFPKKQSGKVRLVRGCSWYNTHSHDVRLANPFYMTPKILALSLGFRIVQRARMPRA